MIPMYQRDYTDSPANFAYEMTYKLYCKAMDDEDAIILWKIWSIYTLTLMI